MIAGGVVSLCGPYIYVYTYAYTYAHVYTYANTYAHIHITHIHIQYTHTVSSQKPLASKPDNKLAITSRKADETRAAWNCSLAQPQTTNPGISILTISGNPLWT